MRNVIIISGLIAIVWLSNLLLMPIEPIAEVIPPSRLLLNNGFAFRYWHYRQAPAPEYLILGNSRTGAGMNPDIISKELTQRSHEPVRVHSLAVGGGFFPFYSTVVTTLLADQLPNAIILGVSPRDFDAKHPQQQEVKNILVQSSGYQVQTLPYRGPFKGLEAKLTDLHAALFPAFFYRTHLLSTIQDDVQPVDLPQRLPIPWTVYAISNHYYHQLQLMKPRLPATNNLSGQTIDGRLSLYWQRLYHLMSWRLPEEYDNLKANGAPFAMISEEPTVEAERVQRLLGQWNIYQAEYEQEERFGDTCTTRAKLETDEQSIQRKFFAYLEQRQVDVYLVVMPGMVLERCENNLAFHRAFVDYLETLQNEFSTIQAVIDLNQDFEHEFMDVAYYTDLEHLTPTAAIEVSRLIAAGIHDNHSFQQAQVQ